MELHALLQLLSPTRHAAITRHAYLFHPGAWRVAAAQRGNMIHLPREGTHTAKRLWIIQTHENRGTPASRWIGPAKSRQARRQRLNQQCQAETFMPCRQPAQWQNRTRWIARQYGRIATGIALRIQHPFLLKLLTGFMQTCTHTVGSHRCGNINQKRRARSWNASSNR